MPNINSTRRGLSLLEIIVALAILVASATIVAQMVSVGSLHSSRALEISEAQTIAHNVLNELLIGIRPWQSSDNPEPVDPWSSWDQRVKIEPVGIGNLFSVRVTIVPRLEQRTPETTPLINADQGTEARERFHLTRWVRRDSPDGVFSVANSPELRYSGLPVGTPAISATSNNTLNAADESLAR